MTIKMGEAKEYPLLRKRGEVGASGSTQFVGELRWSGRPTPTCPPGYVYSDRYRECRKAGAPKGAAHGVGAADPFSWIGGPSGQVGVAWKDKANPDPAIKTLQAWLNKMLDACGYYGIGIDGVVGPGTCGAIAMMGDLKNKGCASDALWASAPAVLYEVPPVCQGWTMPTKKGQTKPDKPTSDLEKSKYALPWGTPDPQATSIQGQLNTALEAIDYNGIPVSGQLDAQTCGAMKLLQDKTGVNWLDAYGMNCQSYILPQPKGGGGGGKGGGAGGGPECSPTKPCPEGQECCQQGWTQGDFGGAQPGCTPGKCVNKCPSGYTRSSTGVCQAVAPAGGGKSSSGLGLLLLGTGAVGAIFLAIKAPKLPPRAADAGRLQQNAKKRRKQRRR